MDYALAQKLAYKLRVNCPYDTGALQASITNAQGNPKRWIITIGNEDASINGTATIEYAGLLNFKATIKGKNNKHYHWVNKAVKEWVEENKLLMSVMSEEEDEEDDELEEDIV